MVVKKAEDVVVGELFAALEKVKLNGEGEAGYVSPSCCTSFTVASIVPPVASRSSTRTTF